MRNLCLKKQKPLKCIQFAISLFNNLILHHIQSLKINLLPLFLLKFSECLGNRISYLSNRAVVFGEKWEVPIFRRQDLYPPKNGRGLAHIFFQEHRSIHIDKLYFQRRQKLSAKNYWKMWQKVHSWWLNVKQNHK